MLHFRLLIGSWNGAETGDVCGDSSRPGQDLDAGGGVTRHRRAIAGRPGRGCDGAGERWVLVGWKESVNCLPPRVYTRDMVVPAASLEDSSTWGMRDAVLGVSGMQEVEDTSLAGQDTASGGTLSVRASLVEAGAKFRNCH